MSSLREHLGVLEPGTHVLEASAGTGKTWTITTLVAAALALGRVSPARVLAVTFTRAATAELRVRVRERIAELAAAFDRPVLTDAAADVLLDVELASGAYDHSDTGTTRDIARRTLRDRLLDALADADAIGVDTIHGWCATVLGQFGDLLGLEAPSGDATTVLPPAEQLTERGALVAAAEAPLAQWIGFSQRIASPAGLTQIARALLAGVTEIELRREDGSVLPMDDAALAAHRAVCERADALYAGLARRWSTDAESLCDQIAEAQAAGRLNGNKWRETSLATRAPIVSRLFSDITSYFTLSAEDRKQVQYFGATELAAATKKGHGTVSLGTFGEELDDLLAMLPEVRAALAAPLQAFVRAVRGALPRRAEDFDDLLRLVADGLEREPAVARRVRSGADLVLIDESQDTDPLQWRIFATLFHRGEGDKRLVLVGDPKQSIYRFRNAEIAVYLEARREASSEVRTLDTNWRSDPALVTAVNTVYEAADQLFGERVTFTPVRPARTSSAMTPALPTPLTFVNMDSSLSASNAAGARTAVASDVAHRIATLLRTPTENRFRVPSPDGGTRPVEARDCAVLVSTNAHAQVIVQALRAAGVHAVAATRQAVTQSATALELSHVLRALDDPGDRAALRGAALTALVRPALGLDLGDPPAVILEALDGDVGRRFDDALRLARARWYARGLMDAWLTLDRTLGLSWHAAAHPDAERRLTDVRHLLELLAANETQRRATPTDTLRWLAERMAERGIDQLTAEELEERLESDEDAVRVLTMHASKGLEFPLVWIPFAWSSRRPLTITPAQPLVRRYDPARGDVVGIVPVGDTTASTHQIVRDENDAMTLEQQRLLYVALTRARHACTVYVSEDPSHAASPLGRLLGAWKTKDGGETLAQRARLLARPGTGIAVEGMEASWDDTGRERVSPLASTARAHVDATEGVAPSARRWTRETPLDTLWRRGSFTALTRGATHPALVAPGHPTRADGLAVERAAGASAPPRVDELADTLVRALAELDPLEEAREPAADEGDERSEPTPRRSGPADRALTGDSVTSGPRVPLADLPRGRAIGNALHDVFERVVQQRAMPGLVADVVPEALTRQGLDAERWTEPLTASIEQAFDVPLIGLGGAVPAQSGAVPEGDHRAWPSLRTLASGRVFTELTFDFAVAASATGARRDALVRARHVGRIFRDHAGGAVPTDYAEAISGLDFLPLRGLLTGAIDLVARHDGRWYLLDYKSNYLGDHVADYTREALTRAMTSHHYVLQYHLYLVALHRYLRLRQPGYDYDTHVGGIAYLFVRGLDAVHAGAGVFVDRPPRARMDALDRLLRDGDTT